MKNVFITGATSGFGEAIAYKLAQHNVNMIITGRTENKLKEVAQKIESTTQSKVLTLAFDVQDYDQCEKAINSIPEAFKPIDVLVNNAGLAVELNPVNAGAIEDWERMINTNIKGLLYVTRLISPQMIEQKKGHIINIGSTASHEIYYGGNAVDIPHFKDGEIQVYYNETIRGKHVFIIQPTFAPAENIMELLLLIDAAKRASAYKIIAVIPCDSRNA